MKLDAIYINQRSATFEINSNDIYYSYEKHDVYLNDKLVLKSLNTNVFSLYSLNPDFKYTVKVVFLDKKEISVEIDTLKEFVTLDVKRFNAKGDGVSNDTNFIQACINACPKGGRVLIPAGKYYTGPLFLKDDITIELDENAVLLGDTNRDNYPVLPGVTLLTDESDEYNLGSWEGNPLDCFASIITGINVKNVNIIGKGIVDGNAQNSDWWVNPREKRTAWRPRGVFLVNCQNINFQGLTVTNTPSWNLHPYFSENIRFLDMKLISPKNSPNTDGCDPESCKNVDIIGVYFSVGDDCIAIKAGKIYMGRKHKKPSENFNIRNCSMNFGHGAVVLGSEMSGGVKNINVSKCHFNQTDRGLRIKTRRGRGKDAVIDGITFEKILMTEVLTPLVINMFYYCDPDGKTEYVWTKEKLPVDDRTPYIGEFLFKDIVCKDVNIAAGVFYGLPEQPIKKVVIDNVLFEYTKDAESGIPAMMSFLDPMKKHGLVFFNVDEVIIKNTILVSDVDPKMEVTNIKNIQTNDSFVVTDSKKELVL